MIRTCLGLSWGLGLRYLGRGKGFHFRGRRLRHFGRRFRGFGCHWMLKGVKIHIQDPLFLGHMIGEQFPEGHPQGDVLILRRIKGIDPGHGPPGVFRFQLF